MPPCLSISKMPSSKPCRVILTSAILTSLISLPHCDYPSLPQIETCMKPLSPLQRSCTNRMIPICLPLPCQNQTFAQLSRPRCQPRPRPHKTKSLTHLLPTPCQHYLISHNRLVH